MQLKIRKLVIKNFKGLRDYTVFFDGDMNIYGANGTFKTTLYTAWLWLITGKDELNRADHELKNTKFTELNKLGHSVEGYILKDGEEIILKREHKEKWVRPRCESEDVYKGNENNYWFNNVPKNATEYQVEVDKIIKPSLIRMLCNPSFFFTLDVADQRKQLLGIAGEITPADILAKLAIGNEPVDLIEAKVNAGKDLLVWKAELDAQLLVLNKKGKEYPARIDQMEKSIPQAENWNSLEAQIKTLNDEIKAIDETLGNAAILMREKQNGILLLQNQLHKKQSEQQKIAFSISGGFDKTQNEVQGQINTAKNAVHDLDAAIYKLKGDIDSLNKTISDNDRQKANYEKQIADKNDIITRVGAEWEKIDAQPFEFNGTHCTTCKQPLPVGDVDAAREESRANFNQNKVERMAAKESYAATLKAERKQLKGFIADLETKNTDNVARINGIGIEIGELESTRPALNSKLSTLQLTEGKKLLIDRNTAINELLKLNAEYMNLQDEIKALESQITAENEAIGTDASIEAQKAAKQAKAGELHALNNRFALKQTIVNLERDLEQLKKEETASIGEKVAVEKALGQLQSFGRAKMTLLGEKVNKLFKYVEFELFKKQENGGIADACVCKYQGVPYSTQNTATKVLMGLDVLNTFSNFFDIHAPVFCDNRESTTFIPKIDSQVISLFVSPADEVLRVEPAK